MNNSVFGDGDGKILYKDEEDRKSNSSAATNEQSDLLKCEKNTQDKNEMLKKRIESLQKSMETLREQLKEEKAMWKLEVEELMNKSSQKTLISSSDDTDSKYSDSDFSISSYERKLLQYQELLQQAQIDKKISLQRQIAISNYKRRLLEVENMCNLELMRVKQNVQYLQPLQNYLSEWHSNAEGDVKNESETVMKEIDSKEAHNEVEMPLELLGNKFQTSMNEIYNYSSKTSPINSMPQLTSTNIWQNEDYVTHSQSTIWYTECQTKFNAF